MSDIIVISWFKMSLGVIFIIILLGVSLYESLKLEKTILIGAFRASVQLIFVGFLIQIIFDLNKWYFIALILIVMVLVAAQTLIRRIKRYNLGMYFYGLIAISFASIFSLILISQMIIQVSPWYDPRYIIPLAGMVIANGMNGAALAGERFGSEFELRLPEMEMLLSLGYDSKKVSQKARQQAITASLIPSLNTMMVMGIVHLPGMMAGQILAGTKPVITTVKYQIIIILGISATVAITSSIFVSLLQKKFFTPDHQICYEQISSRQS